jgi:hypothetical protein
MKKLTMIFITALTFSAAPVFAISTKDLACGAIMCLSGDGGSACSPYLDKYFSIKKKKHGSFCSPCTKIARKAFLQQCDYVDAPIINQVNNQYGGQRQQYNGFDWSQLTPEQREALERFLGNGRF